MSKPSAELHKNEILERWDLFFELRTVFAAHVDEQGERVADPDRAAHPCASDAVAVAHFHVALGRWQREHHRVACRHSEKIQKYSF